MTLRQTIRFCRAGDGTRIAVAECGAGPVLLRAAHWLSHCHHDPERPVWRPWLEAFSARHRFVRYDPRGCGLSDRDAADLSLEAWRDDLETVAASIEARRFVLLGLSQGGSLAIRYAIAHPERVSHLILVNAYAQGKRVRAKTEAERLEAETLVNFVRIGWGRENPAFCRFHTNLFIPGGTPEQHRWWGDLERLTATPEVAARLLGVMQGIDVTALLPLVRVPTLVMHCRGDMRVAFEQGCLLAAGIPGARFVPLESDNHVLLPDEPAGRSCTARSPTSWARRPAPPTWRRRRPGSHRPRPRGKSEKTVRNQLSAILDKLHVRSRAEAIVRALAR
jgi:pimeloyl-ACP methyl ester carboxylesterase